MQTPRPQRPGAISNSRLTTVGRGAVAAVDRRQIAQWLDQDPLFQVLTIDRLGWIDPFTGTVISLRSGQQREVAERYLQNKQPWLSFTLRTTEELQLVRWASFLRGTLEFEGRLRIFRKDGSWLNPFRGEWESGIALEDGKITQQTMMDLAQVLSRCPAAQAGLMLSRDELSRLCLRAASTSDRLRAARPGIATPAPAPEGIALPERELELDRARRVFERLLPTLPSIPGWDLAVTYRPHSFIGGDFYEISRLDERRWFIAVGDVTGHGPGAALVVASAMKSLRYAVRNRGDGGLAGIVGVFNDDIKDMLLRSCFITMVAGILDLEQRSLTCIRAGQHPALLMSAKGEVVLRQIGESGPAIGVLGAEGLRDKLRPATVDLRDGDTLLLYTDGLFEVFDDQQEEFGQHRVMASCLAHSRRPCAQLLDGLVADVSRFSAGKLPDDVTALALRLGSTE